MRYLIIERSDGGVSIRPLGKADVKPEREIEKWKLRPRVRELGWTVVSWFVSEKDPRPKGRDFRDACVVNSKTIEVDIPKARALHMDRIRTARGTEFAKLDAAYMRADERGDIAAKERIAARKQALRDIPQTFDLEKYKTVGWLRKAWPKGLPRGEEQ